MIISRPLNYMALACACALLAACGGGGGGGGGAPGGGPSFNLSALAARTLQPGPPPTKARAQATLSVDRPAAAVDMGTPNRAINPAPARYFFTFGAPAVDRIRAHEAYTRGYYGQGVTVAVLDSGIRRSHRVFREANILPGYDFHTGRAGIDEDYHTDPGHGTQVAAIIGAPVTVNVPAHGVAPSVAIMPLQIARTKSNAPVYSFSYAERAVRYAAALDVQVMNMSFGAKAVRLTAKTPVSGLYVRRATIRIGCCRGEEVGIAATISTPPGRGTALGAVEILEVEVPVSPSLAARNAAYFDPGYFTRVNSAIRDNDTVVVYATGNDGWNNETGRIRVRIRDGEEEADMYLSGHGDFNLHEFIIGNFESGRYGALDALDIRENMPNIDALAPGYERGLFGKWVAVAGHAGLSDLISLTDDFIASYSNGCGIAKYWCLTTPSSAWEVPYNGDDTNTSNYEGTSYAAPRVSGALAVLRSRFPDMPMSALLAILFSTATDVGAPGIDEVYGHGLMNLGAAIQVQGDMMLELPFTAPGAGGTGAGAPLAAALSAGGRIHLPPALAGLRERINNMSVAISYLDGYYYDMPLSRFLAVDGSDSAIFSGNAAADMLQGEQQTQMLAGFSAVINERAGALSALSYEGGGFRFHYDMQCEDCVSAWQRGAASDDIMRPYFAASARRGLAGWRMSDSVEIFAARGFADEELRQPSYEQLGLRWRAGEGPVRMLSEFSRVEEKDSLLGATGDALGDLSAQTYQGRLRLQSSLAGWQLSGDYVYGETKAKAKGGLISGISDLRFAGWGLDASRRSLFRGGDELRFGMRRHAHTRGSVRLWQSRAGEERFVEDLYLPLRDKVEYSEAVVTNLGHLPTIWRAGYSAPLSAGMSAAFALEYADAHQANDEWSASMHLIWKF